MTVPSHNGRQHFTPLSAARAKQRQTHSELSQKPQPASVSSRPTARRISRYRNLYFPHSVIANPEAFATRKAQNLAWLKPVAVWQEVPDDPNPRSVGTKLGIPLYAPRQCLARIEFEMNDNATA